MSHFAQLDKDNVVIWVTHIDNELILDENGVEQESLGIKHLHDTIPWAKDYTWKQTSYNNNFRVRYCGPGYIYDESKDAFIPPKPYDSWTFNEETLDWDPPVPQPSPFHIWDEENQKWILPTFTT